MKLNSYILGTSNPRPPFIIPTEYTVYILKNTTRSTAAITLHVTSYGSNDNIIETYGIIESGKGLNAYIVFALLN